MDLNEALEKLLSALVETKGSDLFITAGFALILHGDLLPMRYQILAGRTVVLVSHDRAQIERLADLRLQLADPAGAPS